MNDITKNIETSNNWIKENRKTPFIITLEMVIKRLKKSYMLQVDNSKTSKGVKLGYLTGILYLAPAKLTGFNFCTMAVNCIKDCLFNSGRGKFMNVTTARIIKTLAYLMDKKTFINHIDKDINRLNNYAANKGLKPCIRLNGTTDLNIANIYSDIIEKYPNTIFYDYTKVYAFTKLNKHSNYSLTFSYDGTNLENSLKCLNEGVNVSMVFNTKTLPKTYKGFEVINGDETDLRFLDKKGVIVGLTHKKTTNKDLDETFIINL